MQAKEALQRALNTTEDTVRDVEPSDYTNATPCSEWDVRALMNHLISELWYLEGKLTGTEPKYGSKPGGLPNSDLVGGDPAAAYKDAGQAALAALPKASKETQITLSAITSDVVVHGWDLAKATGQTLNVDDELADYLYRFISQGITDENRAPAFGPAVEVPEDSRPIDKLVAFLGRNPR